MLAFQSRPILLVCLMLSSANTLLLVPLSPNRLLKVRPSWDVGLSNRNKVVSLPLPELFVIARASDCAVCRKTPDLGLPRLKLPPSPVLERERSDILVREASVFCNLNPRLAEFE